MTVGSGLMVLNDDIMNIDKKKKSYINQGIITFFYNFHSTSNSFSDSFFIF